MPDSVRYAGLWPRFLALRVDFLIFCTLFFPMTRLVKGTWLLDAADHRWSPGVFVADPLCLTFLAIIALYFVCFEGLSGATPGKPLKGFVYAAPEGIASKKALNNWVDLCREFALSLPAK